MGVFSSKAEELQRAQVAAERAMESASRARLAALKELEQDASAFLPNLAAFFNNEKRDAAKAGYLAQVETFSRDEPLAVGGFISFVKNPAASNDREYMFRVTISEDRRARATWNRLVGGGRYEVIRAPEDLGAVTDPSLLSRVEQLLGKLLDFAHTDK